MKHNKNADTLLFLLLFSKSQREKNIEKTFFVSAGAGNTLPFWEYFTAISTKSKK